jgi:acetyltransferase-like isoleucine patch superfamily enzyme
MFIESFILKIKRAETPLYARLKGAGKMILCFQLPVPRAFDPIFLLVRYLRLLSFEVNEKVRVACIDYPTLRVLCVTIGKRLQMECLPNINGPVKVFLGDDVRLSGQSSISGGRIYPDPEFRVGDRTFIGSGCVFSVAKSITIGDDVLIAGCCSISDYSGHPIDPDKRLAGVQVEPSAVLPVSIANKVWLGRGVTILPGVTIGEGAVVGAAAVVTKDVPPGHICVGNPGRVLSRTVYESKSTEDMRLTVDEPA